MCTKKENLLGKGNRRQEKYDVQMTKHKCLYGERGLMHNVCHILIKILCDSSNIQSFRFLFYIEPLWCHLYELM